MGELVNFIDNKYYGYLLNIRRKNSEDVIFPLEWIIFGSKGSTDIDVAINFPPDLLDENVEFYKLVCFQLDKKLAPILQNTALNTDEFPENYFDKPLNSCIIHYNNKAHQVDWTQKGDPDELNNSIIVTFNNHPQMFQDSPITKHMARDLDSKYARCLYMLLTSLTEAELIDRYSMRLYDSILKGYFSLFAIYHSNVTELDKTKNVSTIVNMLITAPIIPKKMHDTLIAVDELVAPLTTIEKAMGNKAKPGKNTIISYRNNLVKLINNNKLILDDKFSQIEQIITDYCSMYPEIIEAHDQIAFWISKNPSIFGGEKQSNIHIKQMSGTLMTISLIATTVHKSKLVVFTENLLNGGVITEFNWNDVNLLPIEDRVDKYKKIAFQLGQTHALYYGIEIFTKEELAERYPPLRQFLLRKQISRHNLDELTIFMRDVIKLYDDPQRKLLQIP
jgi:hypothetical protein